ncbi:MAG TPA: Ada metal-binding domain-containing protein [Ktedonobacterales bacterium]
MKTLRAFLWGSALGALVGLILAPQRDAIAEAQLAEAQDRNAAAGTNVAAAATPATRMAHEAQAQSAMPAMAPSTTTGGRYVGNLNTGIYHEATDADLPNEENRAYFATPEDAEAAGYRAAQ